MENNKTNYTGAAVEVVKDIYETKVGLEAAARVGKNPQLKGVIHEVLVKDSFNANPANIINGKEAALSQSTTAVRDDILIKQGGKIIGRMQLKDTPASIAKTVDQVKSGHYAGTKLVGTKETVNAYTNAVSKAADKGVKITQKMSSSKVSSADTARIAGKALGTSAGKLTAGTIAKAAGSSGAVGAAISGGVEVISSAKKYHNGEIDGGEFVKNVAKETAGGGLSAAAGSVAATAVATGAATVLAATTAPLWFAPAAGVVAATVVGSAVKKAWDFFVK